MDGEQNQKPKRKELFLVIFLRKIGKRDQVKVLQNQLSHEDAVRVRDEYARIGAEQFDKLQDKLQKAELDGDEKQIKQIKAAMASIIAKTDDSTFSVRLDRESNEKFLKPANPVFPTAPIEASEPEGDA